MYISVVDTPFFSGIIDEHNKQTIESMFVLKKYPKGQVIFFYGDQGNEMYIIKKGILKIYRQDEDREIIFGHQFPGEAIGELEVFHHDNIRTASVATIESSELWVIKKNDLLELAKKYPTLLHKTIYMLSERLIQANRKLEYLAFLDTRVRVANLLLDLHYNFGESTDTGHIINWKITQQHIANMIGVTRESAARVIHEFQREGLIQQKNRYIYIYNLDAIQQLASNNQSISEDNRAWHSTHKYTITAD